MKRFITITVCALLYALGLWSTGPISSVVQSLFAIVGICIFACLYLIAIFITFEGGQ